MSTVTFPRLSELLDWHTEHLSDAAASWDATGARCDGVANGAWRDALAIDWQGEGADALRMATHADMLTTSAVVDQLQVAARVARGGASDLDVARSRVRYAIEDARAAGFDVREDLSVVDRVVGLSPTQRAVRAAQARTFAGEIGQRATRLVDLDRQVAGKITAAVAGVRETFATPHDGHVQAVDRHWKLDPAPPPDSGEGDPWENRPPPKDMDDVRDALRDLRRGRNDPHRELDTPDEIRRFYDWLIRGAVGDLPPGQKYPGKVLGDGTEVRWRPDSDSGGPTVEVKSPSSGKRPKVHLPLPFMDDLPPWLKVSPPDFASDPLQSLPIHEWTPPPQVAPHPAPTPVGPSVLSELHHDLAEAGEETLGVLAAGGALVGGLFGIGKDVPVP